MAEHKQQEARVDVNEDAALGLGHGGQVEPTTGLTKDVKARMTNREDVDLHPVKLEHAADRTSIPGPEYPPIERPPVSTTKAGEKIVQSLVTGAGAHVPPDPERYDAEGRPRDLA